MEDAGRAGSREVWCYSPCSQDDGGESLDEDQGMGNKGGAAVFPLKSPLQVKKNYHTLG